MILNNQKQRTQPQRGGREAAEAGAEEGAGQQRHRAEEAQAARHHEQRLRREGPAGRGAWLELALLRAALQAVEPRAAVGAHRAAG